MKFYVVRHPLTEFNVQGITQGWADSPLTPQGIEMANKLGEFLKDKNITKIFSSDLGRCIQTSEIISKHLGIGIAPASELREQNFGKFNGASQDIIKKEFNKDDCSAVPPGGESFYQMKKRVLNYIKNKLPKNKDDILLLVTHEGCFRGMLSDVLNTDPDSNKCEITSLSIGLFETINSNIKLIEIINLG